jgi:hypothetical protein
MTRRWMHSADVEINDATGALLVQPVAGSATAASSFAGGTKMVAAAATPEPLVAASTPCKAVWIGPPCEGNGAPTNTKPVFLGDADSQNLPLLPSALAGVTLAIDDAQKLYVKVGANGEGVAYRIFA